MRLRCVASTQSHNQLPFPAAARSPTTSAALCFSERPSALSKSLMLRSLRLDFAAAVHTWRLQVKVVWASHPVSVALQILKSACWPTDCLRCSTTGNDAHPAFQSTFQPGGEIIRELDSRAPFQYYLEIPSGGSPLTIKIGIFVAWLACHFMLPFLVSRLT